jgi:Family of unknown function (DUF6178)
MSPSSPKPPPPPPLPPTWPPSSEGSRPRSAARSGSTTGGGPETPSNVITLSRYRARLGRTQRGNRLDALMALDDPETAIAAMSGDEIYGILRESDFREAADLLRWATPAQVQIVADFSLWSGDRTLPSRLREWVEMMAELPEETIGAWVRGLDIELVALILRKGARIYDLSVEEPPEESDGLFFPTPDRLFVLDIVGYREAAAQERAERDAQLGAEPAEDGDETRVSAEALMRIVDMLYRDDHELARKILVGAKSELDSELEETAYRWRQGRMADHGFVDAFEALEVYRELDPRTVRLGERPPGGRAQPLPTSDDGPTFWLAPPALGPEMEEPTSLFVRALGAVTQPDEVDELHFALVALANRVLSADRVDPADAEAAAAVMARMRGVLDVAVEFLAREPPRAGGGAGRTGEPGPAESPGRPASPPLDGAPEGQGGEGLEARAIEAVRTVPLVRLFRLGVTLIGKVRALARAWQRKGPFASLPELDLVEEPEATVIAAVARARPAFSRLLDEPPAAGERPFASLADVARATRMIERAAAAQGMLLGLGVRPEHLVPAALAGARPNDPAEIDAGLLARTALVARLLHRGHAGIGGQSGQSAAELPVERPPPFRPLSEVEVRAFRAMVGSAGGVPGAAAPRGGRAGSGGRDGPGPGPSDAPTTPAWATAAAEILLRAAPEVVRPVAEEIAARWVASLAPLEPVLLQADPGAPPPG